MQFVRFVYIQVMQSKLGPPILKRQPTKLVFLIAHLALEYDDLSIEKILITLGISSQTHISTNTMRVPYQKIMNNPNGWYDL